MITQPSYTGTELPAATTTVTLFSTVAAFTMARACAMGNIERLSIDLLADHDGTFKFYKSDDRGATWNIINSIAFTGSSTASVVKDFLVEEYKDFKVDFTVGASNETIFKVDMALTSKRAQG